MKEIMVGAIETPENEFFPRKQELFNLYLKMPVKFRDDWKLFRKRCRQSGHEFEDILGEILIRFNKGEIGVNSQR